MNRSLKCSAEEGTEQTHTVLSDVTHQAACSHLFYTSQESVSRTPLLVALFGDIRGALGNSCGFANCSSVSTADRSPQLLVAFPAGGRAEDEEVS